MLLRPARESDSGLGIRESAIGNRARQRKLTPRPTNGRDAHTRPSALFAETSRNLGLEAFVYSVGRVARFGAETVGRSDARTVASVETPTLAGERKYRLCSLDSFGGFEPKFGQSIGRVRWR